MAAPALPPKSSPARQANYGGRLRTTAPLLDPTCHGPRPPRLSSSLRGRYLLSIGDYFGWFSALIRPVPSSCGALLPGGRR
eukprot:4605093-Pyramimonas_sp.AAC.1